MSTTLRTAIARVASVAIVLVVLLAGCSTKEEHATMYADELQGLKEKYDPDGRLAVFEVKVMSEGLSVDLSSMKSPKLVSSPSPTGDCSEMGC